jgi:hypothetical protein
MSVRTHGALISRIARACGGECLAIEYRCVSVCSVVAPPQCARVCSHFFRSLGSCALLTLPLLLYLPLLFLGWHRNIHIQPAWATQSLRTVI